MWISVDMMMQGQGAVKASWRAVDEWCICVCIVAMWSGSIREGFQGYVSNLGIVCTLLWWQLNFDKMATWTDPTAGEGEDRRREWAPNTGCSGEQISLLLAELSRLKKAVVEWQNEMEKMISRRTRELQHYFL